MKISVIIPVYNKQDYLRGCLDSIRFQTYSDIQVILVDDCSSDDSVSICEEYVKLDSRFQLEVHQQNKGQNGTIVDALAMADGDWVAFVDSDDTLPLDALANLAAFVDDQTDIIVGFAFDGDHSNSVMSIQDWRSIMIGSDVVLCTRWAKLYRRTVLDDYTCSAPDGIKLGEDMIMNIKIAFKTDKQVKITRQKVYEYFRNETSYSVSHRWTVEKYARLYYATRDCIPESEREKYAQALANNGVGMIRRLVLRGSQAEQRKISASPFYSDVASLVQASGLSLTRMDTLMMKRPSSLATRVLVQGYRGAQIIFNRIFKH